MANSINGNDFSTYGFVLQRYTNLFTMPSRIGKTFFNWGDEIQPLVQAEDIHWGTNLITCRVIHDSDRYGVSLEKALAEIRDIKEATLVTNEGTFETILKSVTKVNINGSYATLDLNFEQYVSDFPEVLPIAQGGSGMNIDGYGLLSQFGIMVQEVKHINDIPEYEISNATVYRRAKIRTQTRNWGRALIKCTMDKSSLSGLFLFKKLLSLPELRKMTYKGYSYDCFLSKGFLVNFNRSTIDFTMELNVGIRDSTISIYGNGVKILPNDTTPDVADNTHFGVVDIQGGISDHVFTIQNDGGATLQYGSITIEGEGFSIVGGSSGSINAGGSANFTVRYQPLINKRHNATIKVNNSDLLYTPYKFAVAGDTKDSSLVGVLVAGAMGLPISNGDNTPTEAEHTDFGEVATDKTLSKIYSLLNNGTVPLTIKSISLVGLDHFTNRTTVVNKVINVGSSTTYILRFAPSDLGVDSGLISIVWNNGRDAQDQVFEFTIRGTGIEPTFVPHIIVKYIGTNIPNGSAPSLALGTEYLDQVSKQGFEQRTFSVENVGSDPIIRCRTTGSFAFVITQNMTIPLGGDQISAFVLRFAPQSAGVHDSTILITTASQSFSFDVQGLALPEPDIIAGLLTGNGFPISWSYAPYNYASGTNFGDRIVGVDQYLLQTFVIKNIGNLPLVIGVDSILINDPMNAFTFQTPVGTGVIQPNDTFSFTVRFEGPDINLFVRASMVFDISAQGSTEKVTGVVPIMGTINNTGMV